MTQSRRAFLCEAGLLGLGAMGCVTPGGGVQSTGGRLAPGIPLSEIVEGERAALTFESPSWYSFSGDDTFLGLFAHLMGKRIGDQEIHLAYVLLQSNLARLSQVVELEVSLLPYAYTFKQEYVLAPQEKRIVAISPTFDMDKVNAIKTSKRVQGRFILRNGLSREQLGGEQVLTESLTIEPVTRVHWKVRDAEDGSIKDLRRFVVMLVTPDDRHGAVAKLIREAANHLPSGMFDGYKKANDPGNVQTQIEAIYKALQARSFRYNSISAEYFDSTQRVRLPHESLDQNQGNCVDTCLVFASALEAVGLEPVLVFMSGHMFLGVREAPESSVMCFVETTLVHKYSFNEALKSASKTFAEIKGVDEEYMLCPVRELRKVGFLPVDV